LRSSITDQHVSTCADRLSRRHNPVAFVRRGSGNSLLEELKKAIAEVLAVGHETLSDALNVLLEKASERLGELPLVILIDTATNRESRVARDDGQFLSEIAEVASLSALLLTMIFRGRTELIRRSPPVSKSIFSIRNICTR
jgi:hypothetical protein